MTTEEYLNQVANIDKRLNSKIDQLKGLGPLGEFANTAIPIDMEKINKLKDAICSELNRLVALKARIINEIDNMPDNTENTILAKRYVEGKTWDQIAEEIGYSKRQVCRLHEKALEEFSKVNNLSAGVE